MAPGVFINKMQLCGDTRQRAWLLQSLDAQHWPGEESRKVFLIRKIHVQGYWWELAQQVAQTAQQQLAQGASSNPTDGSAADVAIFDNTAQLSATLSADLAAEKAGQWYWQVWLQQQGLAASVVEVLGHNIFDLPEIVEQLVKAGKIQAVFARLSTLELNKLVQQLVAVVNWPLAIEDKVGLAVDSPSGLTTGPQVSWLNAQAEQLAIPAQARERQLLLLHWVALLGAWKFFPQQIASAPAMDSWLQQVVRQVFRAGNIVKPELATGSVATHSAVGLDSNGPGIAPGNAAIANSLGILPFAINPASTNQDIASTPGNEEFTTGYGGVFFLINALKLHVVADLLDEPGLPLWEIIWHLASKLLAVAAQEIDCKLKDFFIAALSLDEARLQTCSQPAVIEAIYTGLEKYFATQAIWNFQLLALNARVEVQHPYLYVYFDQSQVRLDVRLSGLDINPGWVPGLGRVIQFYYGNYPELATQVGRAP